MPPLTIIGQNCGHVYQGEVLGGISSIRNGVYDPDDAERCLWRAYTTCHTATLIIDFWGGDAGRTDAIMVQPRAGRCGVTDRAQEGVLGPWTTGEIEQCAGLRRLSNGKLLSTGCGGSGDFVLLPRPPEQVGHVCGILRSEDHTVAPVTPPLWPQTSVTEIETCLWQAYSRCAHPATLVYDQVFVSDTTDAAGTPAYALTEHTLVVQPSHGTCTLTDAVATFLPATPSTAHYTCASLSRASDGSLVAQDCGAEHQVTIPSATSVPVAPVQ